MLKGDGKKFHETKFPGQTQKENTKTNFYVSSTGLARYGHGKAA